MIEIITKSTKETRRVAALLAKKIKRTPLSKTSLIVALKGNLGSGKTTFIQGLAVELGIKENVLSPTFLILKDFPILIKQSKIKNFFHVDAYRLKDYKEFLELGFRDLIKNPESMIVIEWADKIRRVLPKNILWINFKNLGKNKRKITISM